MELRDAWRALVTGWWVLVVGLVVGAGAAFGLASSETKLYTASTQFFVSTTDSTSALAAFQGSQFSEQRVTSYAQLITGDNLARRVVDRLDLKLSAQDLSQEISATAVPNTVLIDVSVTDPSPRRAADIAGALGDEFTTFAEDLEATEPDGVSQVKVTVTQAPQVPSAPSSPHVVRDAVLGGLVGLLLGVALVLFRARLDRSVKAAEDAAELGAAPVIGTVLRDDALEKRHTIDKAVGGRTAEDYRQLRTNLQFLNVDEPPKVVMVTSALPSEGKTTMVINLALALAEAGQRVTVVEADLRRPKVTRYLGMVSGVGLTNVLVGTADLDEVTQQYREGLAVIAAGPNPPNPGELLASSHMKEILEKLRGQNDFVLVDAPPLLPVADSAGLAAAVDGVLLSVRYGSTRKDQLRQAGLTLDRVGAKKLGLVLNIVPPKAELATAYGYGYNYGYGDGKGSE